MSSATIRHALLGPLLAAAVWSACTPQHGQAPHIAPHPTVAPRAAPGPEVGVKGPFLPASDSDLTALSRSNHAFAARLYSELAQSQPAGFAVSPASISMALAMTYAGAQEQTAEQMKAALALSMPNDLVHRAFGTLLRDWAPHKDAPYELRMANRLFGNQNVTFRKSYLAVTSDHYRAPLEMLDFMASAEQARVHINKWVLDHTKQKIKDLLPAGSVGPETQLVLANAVYFNGTWAEQFDAEATLDKPFFAVGGEVTTPTMHLEERFQYGEADGNKLLTMPYRGGTMAMTIVLPDARDGLAETESAVAAGKLEGWLDGMRSAHVSVALPKFKISGASLSLKQTLSAMGMPLAFDEKRANFRGMASAAGPNLFIGDVIHKAFVDVHEDGTEAAAATGVVMKVTSAFMPSTPRPFVADHAFLFFLRDLRRGNILFMGRVTDPSS